MSYITEVKDENGVTDYTCATGLCWFLAYYTANGSYHSHGRHKGQITGKLITIEHSFSTELELLSRISQLSIIIPSEE